MAKCIWLQFTPSGKDEFIRQFREVCREEYRDHAERWVPDFLDLLESRLNNGESLVVELSPSDTADGNPHCFSFLLSDFNPTVIEFE